MKKIVWFLSIIFLLGSMTACGNKSQQTAQTNKDEKLPEISISWGNDLHTGVLNLPLKKVDEFKKKGVYLNPLSKDKYELVQNDKKLAVLNFVPTKGGAEVATLMSQAHLDAGLCSNTAILSAVDQGTAVKILCPVQTDGIALVVPPDKNINGWAEVKKYIQDSKVPVKIGYHSSVSGPRIVIESVLKEEGFKVTEDPNDSSAKVLLVDLKGINNLLPSLSSKQVDAWVGPSHHPEAAEGTNVGKIAANLKDFPPQGKWENFPCCVLSAREEVLKKHPEVFKALVKLVDESGKYCMEHKDDSAKVLGEVIGVDEKVIKASTIKYTTDPNEKWVKGINVYVDAINKMNKFNGQLKGKSFEEVKSKVFDFSYIQK